MKLKSGVFIRLDAVLFVAAATGGPAPWLVVFSGQPVDVRLYVGADDAMEIIDALESPKRKR